LHAAAARLVSPCAICNRPDGDITPEMPEGFVVDTKSEGLAVTALIRTAIVQHAKKFISR
jgi:hypothetical protein